MHLLPVCVRRTIKHAVFIACLFLLRLSTTASWLVMIITRYVWPRSAKKYGRRLLDAHISSTVAYQMVPLDVTDDLNSQAGFHHMTAQEYIDQTMQRLQGTSADTTTLMLVVTNMDLEEFSLMGDHIISNVC